jgi:hypothetical protein
MNLSNLSSALPKPWLDLKCNSLEAKDITATTSTVSNLEMKTLSLVNQTSVTVPPSGKSLVYSTSTSPLTTMDSQGTVTTYSSLLSSGANFNTSTSLAAPGQNHLWQITTSGTAPKGSSSYFNANLNILLSSNNSIGLAYSSDYGVTWNNCVFDIASAEVLVVGFNSSVMVAIGVTEAYTSVDGINWVKRASLPSAVTSFNIEWFAAASLFVAGSSTAGSYIMTSPNGQTWTLRTSSIQALTIKSNATTLVAVGQGTPYSQYSTNGITWTNTSSTLTQLRSLAYSPAKNQFFCLSYTTAEGWVSYNGSVWTSVGLVGPASSAVNDTLFWVSSKNYNRWYFSKANTDGNYCLWSSPDATIPFVGTNLDGATNQNLSYSAGYIPSQDRFFIGINNSPYFAYSTSRNDLKAVTDNIRSRGFPVVTSMYSTPADVTVINTTTETIVSTGGIGSLILPDPQALGTVVNLKMFMVVTSGAGDTLTARIKINGATMSTNTITVGAVAGAPVELNSLFTVQATTVRYNNKHIINNTTTQSTGTLAFTRTVINTLSVTLQWGAALSSCTMDQLLIQTNFLNGA